MLNQIKYHADNLNQILEMEGEEGQFEYLIEFGKKSSCLTEDDKNENNLMSGCLAKVWLKSYKKDEKNYFQGDSDALIVKGLVKIIAEAFSGLSTEEIKNVRHDIVNQLGLGPSLSARRQVGMMAMIDHIKIISKAKQ
ncbi:SufE family protein [Alphaproteobacteria bacterium]|nr:SufE family protein [Alphaproteobacteria bacterium]